MLYPLELASVVLGLALAAPARAWPPRAKGAAASASRSLESQFKAQGSEEINGTSNRLAFGFGSADAPTHAALISQMQSDATERPPASSNPSCFFLSLSAIPSSAPCEALSRSDTARIEVAASWAICEIRTAGNGIGKLPRECEDWQGGGKTTTAAVCVEALSRSPQHWSSYSANLREVVTLCSSFRRWADVETARSFYASTASTFDAFLRHLKDYEAARAHRETTDALARRDMSTDLSSLASTLTTLTSGLTANHARHSGSLALLESSLATAISNLESDVSLHLRTEIDRTLSSLALHGSEMSNELQLALGASVREHEKELAIVTTGVRDVLALALRELQESVGGVVDEVDRLDSRVQRSRLAVETSSSVLEEMATTTKDLSRTLSDYHSTQESMLKLHQTHIHDMEEIFANISLAAKDGFSIPELSFGTIMFIASRSIMRRSAHGAVLLVSMLTRPFWWPMAISGATLVGFAAVALGRRLWSSARRASSNRLPIHGSDSPHAPRLLAPDATVSRRRRASRIPARLYNGGSW